jgi:type I pantothenate kinase
MCAAGGPCGMMEPMPVDDAELDEDAFEPLHDDERCTRPSPFWQISRDTWSELAPRVPNPLTMDDVRRLRSLGDPLDLREVAEVYLPLTLLMKNFVVNRRGLDRRLQRFLHTSGGRTPFVIGVAGSVAVGKSTVARLLRELLSRWDEIDSVQLVTTDGFLMPNAELERRGLLARKGFPESYDRRGLLRFLSQVKSGAAEVRAPVYSHVRYDIVPDEEIVVRRPQVLVFEGLNVLQTPSDSAQAAVSDFLDFGIYVDARTSDIERWYVDRFLKLQAGAFEQPDAYFRKYAGLRPAEARGIAERIWTSVNLPNLRENIARTRMRADLILEKANDHTVNRVLLRKL